MSNNIFANIGGDTSVSLQLQTNMRDLASFFDQNDKIKPEHLPESSGDASVLSERLTSVVTSLEEVKSALAQSQKIIDWLGGDLLKVTPTIPYGEEWCATRTFPFAVKLPGGIHAYALKKDQDLRKTTDFEMIGNGKDVPAYTPVVLVAKEKKEYVLSPAPYSAPIDTGLMGTLQPLTFEMRDHEKYKYFVLIPTSKGYPQYTIISGAIVIPPYRSYLRLPKDYVYKSAEAAASSAETATPTDK